MYLDELKYDSASKALRNEETCATACMLAMDKILGKQWLSWEPDTLWLELRNKGISVPVVNRSQIMASRSLITTGRYYYDAIVFEKTCVAFNNDEPNYESFEDAPVEYIAWTVKEAEVIQETFEPDEVVEYDREPRSYIGVQLYRNGFVVAPDSLSWAQEELDKHRTPESKKLKNQVIEEWAATPKSNLSDVAYPETPVGVQIARLAAVQDYMSSKKEALRKDLAKLRGLHP